jgi:hypothetical protein
MAEHVIVAVITPEIELSVALPEVVLPEGGPPRIKAVDPVGPPAPPQAV